MKNLPYFSQSFNCCNLRVKVEAEDTFNRSVSGISSPWNALSMLSLQLQSTMRGREASDSNVVVVVVIAISKCALRGLTQSAHEVQRAA